MRITNIVTGPISTNTWILPLAGKSAAVIDPGGNYSDIVSHISALGLKPEIILLTHGHFDHIAALPELKKNFPGIKTGINKKDAHCLGKDAPEFHKKTLGTDIGFLYPLNPGWINNLPEPDFFLEEGPAPEIPEYGGLLEGWEIIHTPGHTPGSVCIYNKDRNILLSGDTLFCGGTGRTDLPGGNCSQLESSLKKLAGLKPETIVFPGHGGTTTIKDEFIS